MNHHIVATFLAGLSLGLPSYAAAGITAVSIDDAQSKDDWVRRITGAQHAVQDAEARYAKAMRAYGQMRHRRRARGDAKVAILGEQESARRDASEATRRFDELLAEARQAGVPPGWVRDALAVEELPAERAH